MIFSASLIYLIIAVASTAAYFLHRQLTFWKRRGIPHLEPDILSGNTKGFQKTRHIRDLLYDCYEKFKGTGPFAGFFFFLKPTVLITDLDLVKNILIRDFNNFVDRDVFYNEVEDPLSAHMFALDGEKWKSIRTKLSPTFTSGKFMFPTVIKVGHELVKVTSERIANEPLQDVKDIASRFTTDVIGSCAFGLECNSLRTPNPEFRTIGQLVFTTPRHGPLLEGFIISFPKLARKLGMRQIHGDAHDFYMRVVRETVEYREKNSIKRNDFMNLLIETKNSKEGLTMNEVAAQAFVFFLAGFETSSTTMSFALYELSRNQDIQDKLRAEVNEVLAKHGGEFTYECMAEMSYLQKIMKETLRKYSVVTVLFRSAANDYKTSNPKYTIPKGTTVLIPVDSYHRDPEIFPEPEKFDPERFNPEETAKRHPMSWLPFGEGPRNCVGLRFGKMQTYIGLALMVKNFRFFQSEKTPSPLEIDPKGFVLSAKGGIYLRVESV